MKVILSFCSSCGVLLSSEVWEENEGKCYNCNSDTLPREGRIEGEFEESEALKLQCAG